jgi:hypothetical protein
MFVALFSVGNMYLLMITVCLCLTYVGLLFVLPAFFNVGKGSFSNFRLTSILYIVLVSTVGYLVSFSINDSELSNRFLHGFGGGYMAFFTCFLATRDSRVSVGRLRFIFLSVLLVTSLGVANELLEFFLQSNTHFVAATSIEDTWRDLMSNSVGLLFAIVFLESIRFYRSKYAL